MAILRRIANLFRRSQVDREIAEELQAHIALRVEDNLAAGMTPDEARRDALVRFGNPTATRDRVAAADAALLLESVGTDILYACRQLRKSPGFAITAILTLALGIGPDTAVFSVMNSVLLRPLAYPRPDRIFQLEKHVGESVGYMVSMPLFLNWRAQNQAFEHIAAYSLPVGFNVAARGTPERIPGLKVSADFFRVLGIAPQAGRDFTPSEDQPGAQPVVILSNSLWRRSYGSAPTVIGNMIDLDGRAYTVIGILPAGFQFLATAPTSSTIEMWTPLQIPMYSRDPGGILECIARLKDGVTPDDAAAQMTALAKQAAVDLPPVLSANGRIALQPLQQRITGDTRPTVLLLFGAVSLVLVIACANSANLLLARMGNRSREIGVRAALGAGRLRLARQILTECILLASLGGLLGLVIAEVCNRVLVRVAPLAIARAGDVRMDWRVMLFAFAVSVFTGASFGLLPALRMLDAGSARSLSENASRRTTSTRSQRRLSGALVVAEMALSLMLLVAAGLLIDSFVKLEQVQPGFNYNNLATFETTLSVARYGNPAALERLIRDVSQRIEALPGVESVTAASSLPTQPTVNVPFTREDGTQPAPGQSTGESDYMMVSSDYLQAMQIPIRKGRGLSASDTAQSPPVVVINEEAARRYFAGQDPIGKRIVLAKNLGPDWAEPPREIVGVVGDVKNESLHEVPDPTLYTPLAQAPPHMIRLLLGVVPLRWAVRSSTAQAALTRQLQAAVLNVDATEPIAEVRSMRDLLSDSLARWRFNMLLVGAFAGIALLLAAVGIYGVISYGVAQRTREIGIRIALGAARSSVLWMVMRQAGLLLALGALAGLVGISILGRILKEFIYGVSYADTGVLLSITALLCTVGFIAAWKPARRAASIDPMQALRNE